MLYGYLIVLFMYGSVLTAELNINTSTLHSNTHDRGYGNPHTSLSGY